MGQRTSLCFMFPILKEASVAPLCTWDLRFRLELTIRPKPCTSPPLAEGSPPVAVQYPSSDSRSMLVPLCRADSIESRIRSWGCRKSTVKKTSPGMTLLEFGLTWRRPIVPRPAGPCASAISLTARIRRAAVTKSERQFIAQERSPRDAANRQRDHAAYLDHGRLRLVHDHRADLIQRLGRSNLYNEFRQAFGASVKIVALFVASYPDADPGVLFRSNSPPVSDRQHGPENDKSQHLSRPEAPDRPPLLKNARM